MRSSTGSALVVLAVAACGAEPDVTLRVTRTQLVQVEVKTCEVDDRMSCSGSTTLFTAGDPVAAERTLGVFLDTSRDAMAVEWQQVGGGGCHGLVIPLDDLPLDLVVALPDSPGIEIAPPPGCPMCAPTACGVAVE